MDNESVSKLSQSVHDNLVIDKYISAEEIPSEDGLKKVLIRGLYLKPAQEDYLNTVKSIYCDCATVTFFKKD
jgi:hypothetical protein